VTHEENVVVTTLGYNEDGEGEESAARDARRGSVDRGGPRAAAAARRAWARARRPAAAGRPREMRPRPAAASAKSARDPCAPARPRPCALLDRRATTVRS